MPYRVALWNRRFNPSIEIERRRGNQSACETNEPYSAPITIKINDYINTFLEGYSTVFWRRRDPAGSENWGNWNETTPTVGDVNVDI